MPSLSNYAFERIRETTTSTGTTQIELAGAALGFRAFIDNFAVGDTIWYMIVDTDTGDWETGHVALTGSGEGGNVAPWIIDRGRADCVITASSNADAAVDFAAGTKQVYWPVSAAFLQHFIERDKVWPGAPRTYSVDAATVNDANDGLTAPWATIQKAIDEVSQLDVMDQVTVNIEPGTYAETITTKPFKNSYGPSAIVLNCNGTAGAVIISGAGIRGVDWRLNGIKINGGITIDGSALLDSCHYANSGSLNHDIYVRDGGNLYLSSGTVLNSKGQFLVASQNAKIIQSGTMTLSGTPAFATAFAQIESGSVYDVSGASFSGSATGARYSVTGNGIINADGTVLPGNSAGSTATGGQYL